MQGVAKIELQADGVIKLELQRRIEAVAGVWGGRVRGRSRRWRFARPSVASPPGSKTRHFLY